MRSRFHTTATVTPPRPRGERPPAGCETRAIRGRSNATPQRSEVLSGRRRPENTGGPNNCTVLGRQYAAFRMSGSDRHPGVGRRDSECSNPGTRRCRSLASFWGRAGRRGGRAIRGRAPRVSGAFNPPATPKPSCIPPRWVYRIAHTI